MLLVSNLKQHKLKGTIRGANNLKHLANSTLSQPLSTQEPRGVGLLSVTIDLTD